jgi:NTE family protein
MAASQDPTATPSRAALVLSGGGARGAYEVGVLSYLFEKIYPELPEGFEFEIVSGTSVGAIHAAYVAASSHLSGAQRAEVLLDTWQSMRITDVLRVSAGDLLGIPLRALGLSRLRRRVTGGGAESDVVGGLVDLAPLERIVADRIPWDRLRANLDAGRPGVLCVSCTEVRSGRVSLFMDGPLSDPSPWGFDPGAQATHVEIDARHVRASAAIPFLFPSVQIGDRFYVDGGLRMNTPLSPALRLRADRVLVVALKHAPGSQGGLPAYPEDVVTQPAFLLGKVLNALLLDPLEYELGRIGLVNAWLEQGAKAFGPDFLPRINEAVRAQRGVGYRHVSTATVRPSEDVGEVAWRCYQRDKGRALGALPSLLTRAALRGIPEGEADLLSYLYFDRCFTRELVDLGYEDTRLHHDEIVDLLTASHG